MCGSVKYIVLQITPIFSPKNSYHYDNKYNIYENKYGDPTESGNLR